MSEKIQRGLSRVRFGLLVGALGLLIGDAALAQTPEADGVSLDAWRTALHARLDRDLADLQAVTSRVAEAIPDPEQTPEESPAVRYEPIPDIIAGRREAWLPEVVAVLSQHGLPSAVMGVVAVESGFNPSALSPKGARGLWQLMPETARRYGLVVEGDYDERLDPMKSTAAAARYLKDLYVQFQDWPLALAAYNAGEGRVQRSLDSLGARDFWTLSRQAALPDETRRYVPAVLAKRAMPLLPPRIDLLDSPGVVVYARQLTGSGAPNRSGSSRDDLPDSSQDKRFILN
ncbi:MAG: lytic transglycosylase domain-containing protein [Acidobacteria bacterium]|nr:lytic transglycosylase domain-containing protein [Acidobacteriota bacterium]MBI1983699.1 lytic transglycosylase domain-containing protein [Acidobacteriota bacterium]